MLRLPVSRSADGAVQVRLEKSEWLDILPGIRVRFDPIGPKSWRAAQRAAGVVIRGSEDPKAVIEEAGDALSFQLMYDAIREWEGVVDDDEQPIEPTLDVVERDEDGKVVDIKPGTITAFLQNPRVFLAADTAFVMPYIDRLREKNSSSASPNGTGEAATPEPDTASLSAEPVKAAGAKAARTKPTSPKPKRVRSSGK